MTFSPGFLIYLTLAQLLNLLNTKGKFGTWHSVPTANDSRPRLSTAPPEYGTFLTGSLSLSTPALRPMDTLRTLQALHKSPFIEERTEFKLSISSLNNWSTPQLNKRRMSGLLR